MRYHRGDVVETYDVRADGVKQSFAFHRLPAGSGDLVVRGVIHSDLPLGAVDEDSAHWTLPGVGGVAISGVVGIDAHGRQARGTLARREHGIEYRCLRRSSTKLPCRSPWIR